MYANFTPYRVIADHVRAAAFLIADGVVPGNVGRNYVCRMIIRRAARFGTKIALHEPFLARAAEAIIAAYEDFYPELIEEPRDHPGQPDPRRDPLCPHGGIWHGLFAGNVG